MARKKHVTEMTDQEVADHFINYGRTQEYAAVYEVFRVATRLIEPLVADANRTMALMKGEPRPMEDLQLWHTAQQMAEAAGMRTLLAGVVKRYAFANPFGEDDFDPDGFRSVAVAELILQDAAAANRKWDEPIDEEE